jgi:AhpD family alkylhydroperoxidase
VTKLEVFDPAMCCSTGVCGPSVDPALATFAADLDWLADQGVEVTRHNLGQEPGAFAEADAVRDLLHERGEAALPVIVIDGAVRSAGTYPTRDELASWVGLGGTTVVSGAVIAEVAAIGAAIGSNCEPCFKYHYAEARKLGLGRDELVVAVRAAQAVKDTPATKMRELVAKLLDLDPATFLDASSATDANASDEAGGACCGDPEPVQIASGADAAGGCCS